MTKVKIISAISSVGWSGEQYGPFEANQITDLPDGLVQRLVKQGLAAEPIEEPKTNEQTESRLRRIARTQGYDEEAFLREYGRLISEGQPKQDALSRAMGLFEKGAYKAEEKPTLADFMPEKLEAPAPPQVTVEPPKVEVEPEAKHKATTYDKLIELVGYHLAEIYGVRGTGKSRLVHSIALEAQRAGKRVLFIDTEGGLDEKHIKQLKNYEYIGDELEDLRVAVNKAKVNREKYDLLVVDSVGHPVYVNYVTMGGMDAKLKSYQELAALFRDMVRFSRGERGKDMGTRFGLSIAVDHTVSEFARIAKDLPEEEALDPFGGQIHRVPKFIVRSEPVKFTNERSVFGLLTWKARDLPKNVEVARFTIDSKGVSVDWKI